MAFDFNTQLYIGSHGEMCFLRHYSGLEVLDGKCGDFRMLEEPKALIELKVDSYPPGQTPNFFMERYGNAELGSVGGPWKALKDGCEYFVYSYIGSTRFYWFKTKELVEWLDAYAKDFRKVAVPNQGWSGEGYLIPRSVLKKLEVPSPIPVRSRDAARSGAAK